MAWWLWLIIGFGAIVVGFMIFGARGFWKFWKSIENEGWNNMCNETGGYLESEEENEKICLKS